MNDVVVSLENAPWYQSTMGPKVAATVKGVAGLVIPLLQQFGLLKTGLPWLDRVIDIVCLIGFGGYILYGYIRSKNLLKQKIVALQSQVKSLGAVPQA